VYDGSCFGWFRKVNDELEINLYLFNNHAEKRFKKQNVIFCVFHELKHYYQHKYKEKWLYSQERYNLKDTKYRSSMVEREADKFASRMCVKNKKEISEILNVYPDWGTLYYK
jgi:Zn-dependent peptidase ImmA (M78 family)